MELDSIKTQLRELRSCYTDDTKSDDDIMYLVYNWVKTAHAAAQLLLLEGRFPELRRCLDLCHEVLQEKGVDDCRSAPRHVIRRAAGEDRLLIDSLLVRTTQLQQQYEEARARGAGRDAQYYVNKLLSRRGDVRDVTPKERPPTPPERGVLFGRRSRLGRREVPPVLPALVTKSQPFFPAASDAVTEVRSKFIGALAAPVPSGQTSSLSSSSPSPPTPPPPPSLSPSPSPSPSPSSGFFSFGDAKPERVLTDFRSVASFVGAVQGAREQTAANSILLSKASLYSTTLTSQKSSVAPDHPIQLPKVVRSAATQGTSPTGNRFVRLLSARLRSVVLPSGDVEYKPVNDVDAHVVKASIAIKQAHQTRRHSMAVMQSLHEKTSSLVLRKRSRTQALSSTGILNKETGVTGNESAWLGDRSQEAVFYGSSLGDLTSSIQDASFSLKQSFPITFSTSCEVKTTERERTKSVEFSKLLPYDVKMDMGGAHSVNESHDLGVVPGAMCRFLGTDLCKHLSQDASKQLEQVYANYMEKSKELSASMEAMYRKATEQINLFKPYEPIVQLEDTAVWKSRRRAPIVTSSLLESRPVSSDHTFESKSFLSNSEPMATAAATVMNAAANTSATTASTVIPLPILGKITYDSGTSPVEILLKPSPREHPEEKTQEDRLEGCESFCKKTAMNNISVEEEGPCFSFSERTDGEVSVLPQSPSFRGVKTPPTAAQRRQTRLKSLPFVLFPDVHAMVTRRAGEQVEQEQRFIHCAGLSPPLPVMEPMLRSPLSHIKDALRRPRDHIGSKRSFKARTRRRTCAAQDVSDDLALAKVDSHESNTEGTTLGPHTLLSLKELHQNTNWVLLDATTLAMCLPLHLATVRIQFVYRSFFAKRERRRRADAVKAHLALCLAREEAAIVIQQYLHCWLARRQVTTMLLRRTYQLDQCVEGTAAAEGFSSALVISCGTPYGSLQPDFSHHTVFTETPTGSFRDHGEEKESLSFDDLCEHTISPPKLLSNSRQLYCAFFPGHSQHPARLARLRRIQEKIASRVIVRALRGHLHRVLLNWEKENRAYMDHVARRCDVRNTFDIVKNSPFLRTSSMESRSLRPCSQSTRLSLSQSPRLMSSVFPLLPERLTGDVLAAWEARTAEARRWGDFMTPLEPVKLSELQRTLRDREEAEMAQNRSLEELRLREEEETQHRQWVLVNTALLIQRCARGYRLRCSFFTQYYSTRGRMAAEYKPFEMLDSISFVSEDRYPAVTARSLSLLLPATLSRTISIEAHPLPPQVRDTIDQGIRRRHPMWFGSDREARFRSLKSIVLVQSFMRLCVSVKRLAERYCTVCAIIIQRNWRLVLQRRKALKTTRKEQTINIMLGMEC